MTEAEQERAAMTDTPLIRVAKAIWERRGMDPDELCSDHGKMVPLWKTSLPLARAVLEAVREPSEAVADAGMDMLTERGCNPLTGDAEAVWQAMIDAALSK